jgi:multimeric flavodoxin WrbA
MKAIVLNGSKIGDGDLDAVHAIVEEEISTIEWEVSSFILKDVQISHCLGCFGCWVISPGICVIDDAGREIAKSFIQSDLAVFLTPLTFGGYSSELKKALDRIICLVSPFFMKIDSEIHHKRRYEQYPRLMALGVQPEFDPEEEKIFKTLVGRNAINMHIPAHAAGIIVGSHSAEQIRQSIQTLLNQVGVMR